MSINSNDYIKNYYENYDEDGRLGSRHGLVEFLTTMRYIEHYAKRGDRIIEVGAGTGRYSHALARQGYTVDAVELVEHNIEIFKKNTQTGENISITQGNAMDLSRFADNSYDITLLFGPMYHLYTKEDKLKALSEAIRVTKPDGIVFVAYIIIDGCILDDGFKRGHLNISEYIQNGLIDPVTFAAKSEPKELFDLVRKEDIDDLMQDFAVSRLHYIATDGYTHHIKETLAEMDGATFELYLKYHFAVCERADMVGLTNHSLDIFKIV